MPYLHTILEAETEAKRVVAMAEEEAATRIQKARTDIAAKDAAEASKLAGEREAAIAARGKKLAEEYAGILATAQKQADALTASVAAKQAAAVARITTHMVE